MLRASRHASAVVPAPDFAHTAFAQDATVSVFVVRSLVEAVKRAGFSQEQLLLAAKLAPAQLECNDPTDARLPLAVLHQLCECAIDLTGDPALGLHWAARIPERPFVPISPLIANSPSLRSGLESLERFYRLLTDRVHHEVIEQADHVTVRVIHAAYGSARMMRFAAEMLVSSFFQLLRNFSGDTRLPRVSFSYAAPGYHHEYALVFQRAHTFDQPFTGLVFDRALLDAPAPQKDEEVHDALRAVAERRLFRINARTSYALRVRRILLEELPQRTGMETVADRLGLSVRSLRRRLEEEGACYSDVLNEALAATAKRLLLHEQQTIQETAYQMGFASPNAFHRAFKSWTETTPSLYCKAQR